jgi:hypothetical protein
LRDKLGPGITDILQFLMVEHLCLKLVLFYSLCIFAFAQVITANCSTEGMDRKIAVLGIF